MRDSILFFGRRDWTRTNDPQHVKVVAFDKTGTLTVGKPELMAAVPAASAGMDPAIQRASMLAASAAVQAGSEHPLASAVTNTAKGEGLVIAPATGVRAVRAVVSQRLWKAANCAWAAPASCRN